MPYKPKEYPGIMFYWENIEMMLNLSGDDVKRLLVACREYAKTGTIPDFSDNTGLAVSWIAFKSRIENDMEKYEAIRERNKSIAERRINKNNDTLPLITIGNENNDTLPQKPTTTTTTTTPTTTPTTTKDFLFIVSYYPRKSTKEKIEEAQSVFDVLISQGVSKDDIKGAIDCYIEKSKTNNPTGWEKYLHGIDRFFKEDIAQYLKAYKEKPQPVAIKLF